MELKFDQASWSNYLFSGNGKHRGTYWKHHRDEIRKIWNWKLQDKQPVSATSKLQEEKRKKKERERDPVDLKGI